VGKAFRAISLIVILGGAVWLLWPPPAEEDPAGGGGTAEAATEARFVIQFSPGFFYQPDSIPFGVGKPLQGLKQVVREFEARFPDTRVEFTNVPVTVREYLVTQLSSGRAPDIVNVNVEDVWTDVHKGWYVALDPFFDRPNPFVREKGDPSAPGYEQWWDMFRYQAITRGKAAPDGLNYCLTYDMIETGIFYNKKAFKKAGIRVPETWEEFIDNCRKLRAAGYTPIAANVDIFMDWCTDLFFDQLYNGLLPGIDLLKDPIREQYLDGYLDWDEIYFLHEKGFFTKNDPRYVEIWKLMKEFRQHAGKDIASVDLTREFVTERAAMIWNHSQFIYRLTADKELGFEWGIFYLPSFTKQTSKYASNVPMCVIGGSANQFEVTNSAYGDTGDPQTSERLKRVIALLQLLCLPENAERIINEYPALVPNIVGVPVLPSMKPIEEILERPYTTTKWSFTFDLRYAEVFKRILDLYLNDGITLDEYMDWMDNTLDIACDNLVARKPVDMARMQASWDSLAPQRAALEDLPREP
jgi:ABC-type glycerol-3-phosphate transport system substrate-binding protein